MADSLFFALWPNQDTRVRIAGAADQLFQRFHPGGRRFDPRLYHLTLHYLGAHVPESIIRTAQDAAAEVSASRFTLTLDQAGGFGQLKSIPWWLGPRETPAELRQLWRGLRDALRGRSIIPQAHSSLKPHVTVTYNANQILASTPVDAVRWEVDRFVLLHGAQVNGEATYEVIGTWPLALNTMPKPGPAQRDLWDT